MPQGTGQVDLSGIRLKLQQAEGKRYWRSLEEVAETPEFQTMLYREFPEEASDWMDGVSRRKFIALAGASIALAGLATGCARPPQDRIVPYVRPSANMVPGKPLYFATAMPFRGRALGVVATSREGRPVKIEGNPDHPESMGATNVFAQASILNLWDPDRSQQVLVRNQSSTWSEFQTVIAKHLLEKQATKGAGIRFLTRSTSSPTLAAAVRSFITAYPQAKWHHYDPVSRDTVHDGAQLAFGQRLDPIYDFSKADVVVSLDSDFLFAEPGSLKYAKQFIDRRKMRTLNEKGESVGTAGLTMNRLYAVESSLTLCGAMSDHRLPLKPSEIASFAAALAQGVGAKAQVTTTASSVITDWAAKVANDLKAHKGKSIVVVGDQQPGEVHALAFAINEALGNIGQTVDFIDPVTVHGDASTESLKALVADMSAGTVDTLFVIGANPVYDTPGELDFFKAYKQVGLRVHMGEYHDETGFESHWHLPETHYLEAWGDLRGYDGTVSIVQPLIAPLYQNKSALELISILSGHAETTPYEIVRRFHSEANKGGDFESWWKKVLEKGVVDGTALKGKGPALAANLKIELPAAPLAGTFEAVFLPDPTVWDGCYANNGWLQELPKPMTHITWDNAVFVSPKTGETEKVENGDLVAVNLNGREVWGAIWVMAGHPDNTVTLPLGYGRERAGRIGGNEKDGVGFNFYKIKNHAKSSITSGVKLRKVDQRYNVVATHTHQAIWDRKLGNLLPEPGVIARPSERADGKGNSLTRDDAERDINNRKLVRVATLEQFKKDPEFARKMDEEQTTEVSEGSKGGKKDAEKGKPDPVRHQLQLYPSKDYGNDVTKGENPAKHRWGMSIDIQSCIGCNACIVACQSENNISVVGKEQVDRGREMHWLRIDTYFAGGIENPETYFEPVTCMHCENAPCELVCPVAATAHDDEGINNMVYNRCVGTRYCSNNCPYKVRRFNFLHFSSVLTESERLGTNPEVTIRTRGVMEKCSYCIQRVNNTRIEIEKVQVRIEEQIKKSRSEEDKKKLREELDATGKRLLDGLETACQQTCPTEAIVFGDLNDTTSKVFRAKMEPHDFGLLDDLTTKPRTTYLARMRNPNPEFPVTDNVG